MTVTRRHATAEGWREAVYSNCELYRYRLTICWDETGRHLLCIMLNPSKATELANDPTIERCERRARRMAFGRLTIVNLFALRETSPVMLKAAQNPVGPDNARMIDEAIADCDTILAAWGMHGAHLGEGARAETLLRSCPKPVSTLGLTGDGHPRHPLYVAYAVDPQAW